MSLEPGFAGSMAGFIDVLLMAGELRPHRQKRARELIKAFNEQTGYPSFNKSKHLQDNISESQALAIESDIRKIMGEMK